MVALAAWSSGTVFACGVIGRGFESHQGIPKVVALKKSSIWCYHRTGATSEIVFEKAFQRRADI
jgi:hypothetical protein